MTGQKRTWQQVKIKYKNIFQAALIADDNVQMRCINYLEGACSHILLSVLISAVKKKAHVSGTGGGPPTPDPTSAEELALDLNQERPVMEGIRGGTATDCVPPT